DIDIDGAARELGDGAGREREPETGHGNIVFLIHIMGGWAAQGPLGRRRSKTALQVYLPFPSLPLNQFREISIGGPSGVGRQTEMSRAAASSEES
ncbi:MAG: hypothetical protein EBT98_08400, partial [Opitutaceae bacterium]|nr:hypothetical protein [Opitutaceae bacterium]